MRKTTFIFAGIMSAVIGNAYATGENTVTSKSYVDAQDALKQNKLHTASATPANNGTTVVTYTDTEGATGERGIFDYETGWDDGWVAEGHEDELVTAEAMSEVVSDVISTEINNMRDDQEPVRVVKTTCANSPDCTLWTMQDVIVHQLQCETVSDCSSFQCRAGQTIDCVGGMCKCINPN